MKRFFLYSLAALCLLTVLNGCAAKAPSSAAIPAAKPAEGAEAPKEAPASTPGAAPNVGLATPFANYETLEAAREAYGAAFPEPKWVPAGFACKYRMIWRDGSIAQLRYEKGEQSFLFRVSRSLSPEEMNGDYNVYDSKPTVKVGEIEVRCLGNGEKLYNAMWKSGEYAYCVLSDEAMSAENIKLLAA